MVLDWKEGSLDGKNSVRKFAPLPDGNVIAVGGGGPGFWSWEIYQPLNLAILGGDEAYKRVANCRLLFINEIEATEDAEKYACDRYLADRAQKLFERIGRWSNKTFGDEAERGPKGPLWHLAKEVVCECLGVLPGHFDAFMKFQNDVVMGGSHQVDVSEIRDVLILLMDATRRAGLSWCELVSGAEAKMDVNVQRHYPKPTGDEISEHDRSRD
jgi:hypothetical protein